LHSQAFILFLGQSILELIQSQLISEHIDFSFIFYLLVRSLEYFFLGGIWDIVTRCGAISSMFFVSLWSVVLRSNCILYARLTSLNFGQSFTNSIERKMYFQLVLSLDFLELLIQILFNQAQMIIRCLFMHIFVVARIGQVIFFKVCDLGLKFFVSFLLSSQQLVNPLDFL
jgi:hypothetical protein